MLSYSQIAWAAHQAGRPSLAYRLLRFESKVADRIPPLLAMELFELALQEVAAAHDDDLIEFVLRDLYSRYILMMMMIMIMIVMMIMIMDNSSRYQLGTIDKKEFISLTRSVPLLFERLLKRMDATTMEDLLKEKGEYELFYC